MLTATFAMGAAGAGQPDGASPVRVGIPSSDEGIGVVIVIEPIHKTVDLGVVRVHDDPHDFSYTCWTLDFVDKRFPPKDLPCDEDTKG